MINESINANLRQLPEPYQEELLDFSEFLLMKASQKKLINKNEIVTLGSRKQQKMITNDKDNRTELIHQNKVNKKFKGHKQITAVELLQMSESQRMNILKEQSSASLRYYTDNDESTLPDLCEDLMEYK